MAALTAPVLEAPLPLVCVSIYSENICKMPLEHFARCSRKWINDVKGGARHEFVSLPGLRRPLSREERAYRCPAGHSYDIAREGYTSSAAPQSKNTPPPPAMTEMAAARRDFPIQRVL